MADNTPPSVLTCPFCGRPDAAVNMLEVQIEHRLVMWPTIQMLCTQCAAAVGQAIRRELDAYNDEGTGDELFHFGLGGDSGDAGIAGDGTIPPDTADSPLNRNGGDDGALGHANVANTVRDTPR